MAGISLALLGVQLLYLPSLRKMEVMRLKIGFFYINVFFLQFKYKMAVVSKLDTSKMPRKVCGLLHAFPLSFVPCCSPCSERSPSVSVCQVLWAVLLYRCARVGFPAVLGRVRILSILPVRKQKLQRRYMARPRLSSPLSRVLQLLLLSHPRFPPPASSCKPLTQ